ncbi:MAG: hypothetical protein JOY70_00705 [Acidisphaera sp.]|nr:hypothetical protein [Acidisphaera sp.]MBV9811636.1 hypothetical protein [Acetobacteraceae bacterium]
MTAADPRGPLHAATLFAELVAAGLMAPEEAAAALADAARRAAPARDARGMRTRLAHRLADATEALLRRRTLGFGAVARTLAPLLAVWADPATLRAAARQAAGGRLSEAECEQAVAAAVARRLG